MSTKSITNDNKVRGALAILVIVCTAQFMLLIDDTIVNVALPSIAGDLGLDESQLSWVPNAYLLMFGGFLLIGGRMADLLGRRRMFMASMAAFVTASAICGLAGDSTTLIVARGAQGLAGAFMSPAALSILLATFVQEKERTRALAAWSSLTALGAATGLLLGGAITDLISWNWIFWINLPIGLVAMAAAARVVPAGERHELTRAPGLTSALAGTAALLTFVYTVVETSTRPWGSTETLFGLAIAALFAVAFVISERRAESPLVPAAVVSRPNISLGNAYMFLAAAGLLAMFFFVTLFLQNVKGYSPFEAGAAWLPFSVALGVFSGITAKLIERFSAIPFLVIGAAVAAAGTLAMAQVDVGSGYLTLVMPSMVTIAAGFGLAFVPILGVATGGVEQRNSGIASGLLTSSQQIGGAVGIAALVTIATSVTGDHVAAGVSRNAALVDGFQSALMVQAGILVAAACVGVLIGAFARESGRLEGMPVPA
ncbi:MAG: MFS transporter [Solirubrobacterales bacterium]